MKTYFRLLSFAKPIEKFAIPYVIATLFAVVFNTLNLALLIPLLETLFEDSAANQAKIQAVIKGGAPAITDLSAFFTYYVDVVIS